jgi:hypothetical protein
MARQRPLAAIAAAALMVSSAAQAAPPKPAPLADVFAAFKAICYTHAGDPAAQALAATSAPYSLTPGDKSPDGSQVYHGENVAVSIRASDGKRFCMATAPVTGDPSPAAAKALAKPVLGEPLAGGDDAGTVLWTDTSKKETTVYLYLLKPIGDQQIGAFAVGVSNQ